MRNRILRRMRSREAVASFDRVALRRLRDERNLTQEELASLVFRDARRRTTIAAYETGSSLPGIDAFTELVRKLGVEPFDLLTVDEEDAALADHRARLGLSKARFADLVSVDVGEWDAIERGRQPFRTDVALRAAEVLEIELHEAEAAWKRGRSRLRIRHLGHDPDELEITADRLDDHADRWRDELGPDDLEVLARGARALRATAATAEATGRHR